MPHSLAVLAARAQRVRELYAKLESQNGGRPWTRAELAQGFVVDIGDLMRLLMAKDGVRSAKQLDARLRHEFGDCLWSLLVLAESYGVDLEDAFHHTMNHLEAKLAPGPGKKESGSKKVKTPRQRRG